MHACLASIVGVGEPYGPVEFVDDHVIRTSEGSTFVVGGNRPFKACPKILAHNRPRSMLTAVEGMTFPVHRMAISIGAIGLRHREALLHRPPIDFISFQVREEPVAFCWKVDRAFDKAKTRGDQPSAVLVSDGEYR